MYCPNCGAQNKKKQNFCRYCGLHLQDIEKTFLNQMVFGQETKQLKNLRRIRQITDSAQTFSVITLFIGIIAAVFSDSGIGKVLMTAGLLSFFAAQTIREVVGYFRRRNSEAGEKQNTVSNISEAREFETKETNKLLKEKHSIPVPNVTENSTELLFADKKTNVLK